MALHLAEVGQAVTPGAHAVVVVDGAGWSEPGRALTSPDNNSIFSTYDAIVDASFDTRNVLVAQPGITISVATRNWAKQVSTDATGAGGYGESGTGRG